MCPNINYKNAYLGETDRKSIERIIDHNKRGKKSHLLKHARGENYTYMWEQDFNSWEQLSIKYKKKNQ